MPDVTVGHVSLLQTFSRVPGDPTTRWGESVHEFAVNEETT
jgi:hypothetical protein